MDTFTFALIAGCLAYVVTNIISEIAARRAQRRRPRWEGILSAAAAAALVLVR